MPLINFDELIEQLKPKSETYTIKITETFILEFKVIDDFVAWREMQKEATELADKFVDKKAVPEPLKEHMVYDREVVRSCSLMKATCVTPGVTLLDFMKVVKRLPLVYETLRKDWAMGHINAAAKEEAEEVKGRKEASSATAGK